MEQIKKAAIHIEEELEERVTYFKSEDKLLEAQRISERTNFDMEMLKETGFCSGIENYSRHLSGLEPGQAPYTLMDYFGDDYLIIVDESHKTVPQIRGMYDGMTSYQQKFVKADDLQTLQKYEERIAELKKAEENTKTDTDTDADTDNKTDADTKTDTDTETKTEE